MISQGFAKLTSNLVPVLPWYRPSNGGMSTWEAIILTLVGFVVFIGGIALTRWWSE
jgi:hypothetical protein